MNNEVSEVMFEILEHLGTISEYPTGWKKEMNMVSWNGGIPKYDIRDWSENHERMSRGITLSENEMKKVYEIMRSRTGKEKK